MLLVQRLTFSTLMSPCQRQLWEAGHPQATYDMCSELPLLMSVWVAAGAITHLIHAGASSLPGMGRVVGRCWRPSPNALDLEVSGSGEVQDLVG